MKNIGRTWKTRLLVVLLSCIGVYYLLPTVLGIWAACELGQPEMRNSKFLSFSLWFIAVGIFFLCSGFATWKRSKHSSLFVALAITNAVVIAFGQFNSGLADQRFSDLLESVVAGIVMGFVLCWWLFSGASEALSPQIQGELAVATKRRQTVRAWQCFVSLVYLQIVLSCLTKSIFLRHQSENNPLGLLALYFGSYAVLLFVTFLFSAPKSVSELYASFGLRPPAVLTAIISAALGAVLATIGILVTEHSIVENTLASHFLVFGQAGERYLIILVLSTPLIEEAIIRGYLYPAIRQTYSVYFSIAFVLATLFISHAAIMFGSLRAGAAIIGLNILACVIREKTSSLWNCIICHFAYNFVCVVGLMARTF